MRVRIIFRGLVVLGFKADAQSQQPVTVVDEDGETQLLHNRGVLEAWLVSDKRHRANASSAAGMSDMHGMAAMGSMGSMGSMGGPNALHSHTPRMSVYGAVRIGDE